MIIIDNYEKNHSIFQAYNEGVRRAQGDILCFMHEDILFHSNNWGKIVTDIFDNKEIGIVGVIGSFYLPKSLSYWDNMRPYLTGRILGNNENYIEDFNRFYSNSNISHVAVVDGLFFCIPKVLFERIAFDESFKGFHIYDMDICMQVNKINKKILVAHNISIQHLGEPNFNNSFVNNLKYFYNKWKFDLPISKGFTVDEKVAVAISESALKYWELYSFYLSSRDEVNHIAHSKAYRLGKFILRPWSYIQRNFNIF